MNAEQPVYLRVSPETFRLLDGLLQSNPNDPKARSEFESAMHKILTVQDYWQLLAARRKKVLIKVVVE